MARGTTGNRKSERALFVRVPEATHQGLKRRAARRVLAGEAPSASVAAEVRRILDEHLDAEREAQRERALDVLDPERAELHRRMGVGKSKG